MVEGSSPSLGYFFGQFTAGSIFYCTAREFTICVQEKPSLAVMLSGASSMSSPSSSSSPVSPSHSGSDEMVMARGVVRWKSYHRPGSIPKDSSDGRVRGMTDGDVPPGTEKQEFVPLGDPKIVLCTPPGALTAPSSVSVPSTSSVFSFASSSVSVASPSSTPSSPAHSAIARRLSGPPAFTTDREQTPAMDHGRTRIEKVGEKDFEKDALHERERHKGVRPPSGSSPGRRPRHRWFSSVFHLRFLFACLPAFFLALFLVFVLLLRCSSC